MPPGWCPRCTPQFSKRLCTPLPRRWSLSTLDQLYGTQAESGSIDDLLADLQTPLEDDSSNDQAVASAASDNELVKFVNKVIVDAYHQGASDIHIEPMPGKAKRASVFGLTAR